MQLLVDAASAQNARHRPLDHAVRRVRVEGADHRPAGVLGGDPAHHGSVRLVDVDDVEAAVPKRVAEHGHPVRGEREVRDRAVRGDADRPAQRDEPRRHGTGLRPGAIIRVVGGEQSNVVPAAEQFSPQRLDVPAYPARIRKRIRGDQRYAHRSNPSPQVAL